MLEGVSIRKSHIEIQVQKKHKETQEQIDKKHRETQEQRDKKNTNEHKSKKNKSTEKHKSRRTNMKSLNRKSNRKEDASGETHMAAALHNGVHS